MKLTILGASPSFPNPGAASSGYLVQSGSQQILVDCGHGVAGVLQTVTSPRDISAIILSHMHPDHFFDLVPLKYAFQFIYGMEPRIPLLLPPRGTLVLQRLAEAVGLPETFFDEAFSVSEYEPAEATEMAGLSVHFAPTRHFVQGYAMRFSSGQTGLRGDLVYTSDTAWTDSVLDLARGACLVLAECAITDDASAHDHEGHMTPSVAARLASEAGVERLVLTHYWHENSTQIQSQAAAIFGQSVDLAVEGMSYNIP